MGVRQSYPSQGGSGGCQLKKKYNLKVENSVFFGRLSENFILEDRFSDSSEVTHCVISLQLHGLPVAYQAPLFLGFSRQEYWSGSPFPSLGNLSDTGIQPVSPALAGGFYTS